MSNQLNKHLQTELAHHVERIFGNEPAFCVCGKEIKVAVMEYRINGEGLFKLKHGKWKLDELGHQEYGILCTGFYCSETCARENLTWE